MQAQIKNIRKNKDLLSRDHKRRQIF